MRIGSTFVWIALALAGCGGKVVFEGGAGGAGGSGGTTNSSVTTSSGVTPTTGSGVNCGSMSCGQGSDGSCSCAATCDGQALEVDCVAISGGVACTCIENGIAIGKCQQTVQNACDFFAGCCAPSFFGI